MRRRFDPCHPPKDNPPYSIKEIKQKINILNERIAKKKSITATDNVKQLKFFQENLLQETLDFSKFLTHL